MNKKVHLLFFLLAAIPLFLTAQLKPVGVQNQPVQKTILPSVKPAQPAQTKEPVLAKQPAVAVNKGGKAAPRHIRRHGPVVYGNEWINYSQYYYKIKVAQNGIYRISAATLANAGINIGAIADTTYQIYFRGQQQYIYVKSSTTNLSAANGDYIEFYGQYNDGVPDSTLYTGIGFLPNPYYSLFNDTSTYYLTWSASISGNRMKEQADTSWTLNHYTPSPYVIASTTVAGRAFSTAPANNLSPDVYFINAPQYFAGTWQPDGTYTPNDPRFTQNSAWTTQWIAFNSGAETYPLNVNNVYSGGPGAFMRTVVLGVDNGNCNLDISYNAGSIYNNIPFNTFFNSMTGNYTFRAMDTTYTFPSGTVPTSISFTNIASSNSNIVTPTYIYLNYPHTLNVNNDSTFMMGVPDGSAPKAYLDFTNLHTDAPADSVRMYDLTNHNRFWVKPEGGGFKVLVPNSGGLKQCYLTSDLAIHKVTSLTPVGVNQANGGIGNGQFTNFSSEPDNVFLIITHPALWADAQLYAQYRQYAAPIKHATIVADVEELYDQFGEGIDYSPLGIKRFCQYAIDKWASPPADLFLVGKGIHTPLFRPDTAKWTRAQLLVPSFGYPSSDILFTNGLDSIGPLEPAIPTGRLAAVSNAEVNLYLSKVETFEGNQAALWMKNVAHFAGGNTAAEELGFANDLDNYANTIMDTVFGAKVYLFQKATANPISGTLTDSIVNLIDNGVSIMTFFGHAGGSNWDESVDYPSDYANNGKYPFMMADACFSGDIYQPIGVALSSVSEQWVLNPPGAIGFLASDYLGNPGQLNSYTQQMYDGISYRPFYRKPIGQIIQHVFDVLQNTSSQFMICTLLEVTLHGDPAIALNAMDSLPDYAVNEQSIYFTPSTVSVLQDSFNVNVIVYNYGAAINQAVAGSLVRKFPDGVHAHTYPFNILPPKYPYLYYADTVVIKMPVNDSNYALGQGLNSFTVSVDLNPSLPELTYNNNSLGSPVYLWITSEDVTPVWPYDYAIIPNDTATLKASTNDPFAPQRTYIFEIDTSHSFNSPLFKSDTVTNSGGVLSISPYANWGTTHFHGLVQYSGGGGSGSKTGSAVNASKQNSAIANQAMANEKLIATQSNLTDVKPVLVQPNPTPSAKAPVAAGAVTPSPMQAKGVELQKVTNPTAKTHKQHGPINNSFVNNYVYYWRVRRDTADSTLYPWVMTSFQYIKGKNGWGQTNSQNNLFQFDNDEIFNDSYDYITLNTPKRDWTFNTVGSTLQCTTYGTLPPNINTTAITSTDYSINDYIQGSSGGCTLAWGIYVAVIDPLTLIPWNNTQYNYHQANGPDYNFGCNAYDAKYIFFDNDSNQMKGLVTMLQNIPTGDYILAYSYIEGAFKKTRSGGLENADSVVAEFANLGATQMPYHANTPGLDSVPWIFFVQKGVAGTAKQIFGTTSITSTTNPIGPGLQLSAVLKSNGTYGAITTPLIGPAARYDSLSWSQHPDDAPPLTDSTRLNIIGVQPNGKQQTLVSGVTPTVANMLISSINPTLFPYIQLALYTKDITHRTPAQMNWWRVFYQPVPEIAVNPNVYTYYHADTLEYGDKINFQTTVQNISDWPIASTQLLTWISSQANGIRYYNQGQMVKALNPGDTAKISFTMLDSNSNINALKSVWFEVNPEAYPDTRLEQYHFNNYAEKSFYSYSDKINPVVDVTFNGIHILNNDIVSATPSILMTFMDENKFLPMNNSADFKVYLNPVGGTPQLQSYGPTLSFTPAVLPHNKCSLLLTPTLPDGTYQLTVQGTDIAGNPSANNSYTIDFQVINKSMITEVLNYPNPFSTSTRFVFILTGEQIPTTFKIQIMTVSGKIVREISEDEIGPIHIGRNITQYAWDGTDQYGSKLANGVYLYRVITYINGNGIDEYQQGYQGANIDQYFTKGWGKMYLMR